MNIEYVCVKGRICDGGNERLRYKIEIPEIDGAPFVNDLCRSVMSECESFCRQELLERVLGGEIKMGVRYFYSLEWVITHMDSAFAGSVISVCLREEGQRIVEQFYPCFWELTRGMLISSADVLRAYRQKGEKYPRGEKIFLLDGKIARLDSFDKNAMRRLLAQKRQEQECRA